MPEGSTAIIGQKGTPRNFFGRAAFWLAPDSVEVHTPAFCDGPDRFDHHRDMVGLYLDLVPALLGTDMGDHPTFTEDPSP
jgi:hypothetical protein